ncbi:MAG TPA: MaoC family dehydratase [Candidatus Baltobacteraceae bacterium]|jgi:acyl dehydratase
MAVAVLKSNVAAGDVLPEIARQFRLDDFKRKDEQTIHTDMAAAQREGLAAPVAIGPQVASLIFRQLREAFGPGWLEGGTCSLTFRRPVLVTDFCVARGKVTGMSSEAKGVRVACEVWIENQRGEKVIVGSASGILPKT